MYSVKTSETPTFWFKIMPLPNMPASIQTKGNGSSREQHTNTSDCANNDNVVIAANRQIQLLECQIAVPIQWF